MQNKTEFMYVNKLFTECKEVNHINIFVSCNLSKVIYKQL